jgi:exosome complex component RRP41
VAVHVLDADGGDLAAAIIAASLALADAGVPMRDVVAAAPLARVGRGGGATPGGATAGEASVLDPTAAEGAACSAGLTLALMPAVDRVTQAVFAGAWGPDAAEAGVGLAAAAAAGVGDAMRLALRQGG